MSADDLAFRAAWDRFAAGVATWTPAGHAALRASATDEQIAALESELGFALHPALRALLATHDGAEEILPAAFLPRSYRLATTAEIAEEYRSTQEMEELRWWVPFGLPWSEGSGVVHLDHRPGPAFGAVHEYGAGPDLSAPDYWGADLAEFFSVLADSLASGEPFRGLRPVQEESLSGKSCLSWEQQN